MDRIPAGLSDYICRNHRNHYAKSRESRKKERKRIENMNVTRLTRHVGSTTYNVKIYLPQTGNENMEEKILRMIQNEALENAADCGTIDVPQMSRPSERSANVRQTD